jgi:hypothetical protein
MILANIVHDCVGHGCRQGDTELLSHGDIVGLLVVHTIIVSALPLYRIHERAASVEPAAMGMRPKRILPINDERLFRTLYAIGSARARLRAPFKMRSSAATGYPDFRSGFLLLDLHPVGLRRTSRSVSLERLILKGALMRPCR